jgi:hypothetical protein
VNPASVRITGILSANAKTPISSNLMEPSSLFTVLASFESAVKYGFEESRSPLLKRQKI